MGAIIEQSSRSIASRLGTGWGGSDLAIANGHEEASIAALISALSDQTPIPIICSTTLMRH